jgi:glycosyltransferase involved in cell wall biosynthesis
MADNHHKRTRVLWLIKGLGPGGAERLLVQHARLTACDALAFEVAYLLPWKEHLAPDLAALGVATHCLHVRSVADPRWVHRLRRLVRTRDIDVVHAHSPALAACARPALRASRQRPALVFTEHNRWPSYGGVTRLANRATIGLDDATLAVSDDVRTSMGRAGTKTRVVMHGVDVARLRAQVAGREAVRAELGVPVDDTLVVTVANLRPGKAYGDLLAAARKVLDRGERFVFVAAGQGPQEAELRALHDHLGLGDRFRLLGYFENAARLTAAADLFVLASVHEGLPVAVMEALALGVPVVATRAGGVPELVESAESGLLVEPGNPGQLAAAIRTAADPATRARLAEGAARRGATLDARPSVEHLDRLYVELARSRAMSAR